MAAQVTSETRNFQQFPMLVPGMTEEMFYPDFWVERLSDADKVIMTPEEIALYNAGIIAANPKVLSDLNTFPAVLSEAELKQIISETSKFPLGKRFDDSRRALTEDDLQRLSLNLNIEAIQEQNPVRWAVVTEYGEMRAFPTFERSHNALGDPEVDMFLETGMVVGEPVAVLGESKDGLWALVRRFNYTGWVPMAILGFAEREKVLEFSVVEPRLVVTGAEARTALRTDKLNLSQRKLEMGDSLPLSQNIERSINRMSVHGNFVVDWPVRGEDGNLELEPVLINRNQDVNIGYLPYTNANIIRQAFKFSGERYGWGNERGTRDCTGFIGNVYRSFNVIMPRNSGQRQVLKSTVILPLRQDGNRDVDIELLKQLQIGDSLTSATHVMLYLGEIAGEHYVIHDTLSIDYRVDGVQSGETLRQVAVTPLLELKNANNRCLADYFPLAVRVAIPDGE